jgi:tetratricopeptide (TPR) repeat protein
MLGFAWLTLRQAQEAIRTGRLEEAQRLLHQPAAQGHRKHAGLVVQLAGAFAERGERRLKLDDTEAAWRDLIQAEALQTGERSVEQLRQTLNRLAVAEVRATLQTGDLRRAEEAIARFRGRRVMVSELGVLEEAVKTWLHSRELADCGEFGAAQETFERVRKLLPAPANLLEQFRNDLELRHQKCDNLLVRLNEVCAQGRWPEAIDLAGQVLAIAPSHPEARRLRSQAWKAVEPATLPARTAAEVIAPNQAVGEGGPSPRYLLWIDGVGGYLVCLGNRITLGQAAPGSCIDVPLIADVSRMHATLTRDKEGYLLEAIRSIQVNGQPVTQALLRSEDRITLGASCQMIFRQPVPLSLSARLDLVSGHRLPLAIDAALVMADTLVLGPGSQVHVTVPDLKEPIILFRNKDRLGLRGSGPLVINGQPSTGRCLLDAQSAVQAGECSFSVEPAGPRLG